MVHFRDLLSAQHNDPPGKTRPSRQVLARLKKTAPTESILQLVSDLEQHDENLGQFTLLHDILLTLCAEVEIFCIVQLEQFLLVSTHFRFATNDWEIPPQQPTVQLMQQFVIENPDLHFMDDWITGLQTFDADSPVESHLVNWAVASCISKQVLSDVR